MSDNGIKVTNAIGSNPVIAPPLNIPRVPKPQVQDHGHGSSHVSDHSPVTNLHKMETAETPAAEVVQEATAEVKLAEKAKQMKEEWSMAEKARKMEANAQKLKNEAKAYEEAVANFDKDPLALAKALNIPVDVLLRKLQGAAFNIPTEEVKRKLTPEEEYKLKAMQYEQKMQALEQDQQTFKNQVIQENYINKHLLPILNKDPDKYELIHKEGLDESTRFIFGQVVEHFHKNGQEPNPQDIVDAYEAELEKNFGALINNFKGVKKFKNLFEAKEALAEAEQAVVIAKAAVAAKTEETGLPPADKVMTNVPKGKKESKVVSTDNTIVKEGSQMTRNARLDRIKNL